MLIKPTYKILNKELTSANASQYRMSINIKIDGLSLLITEGDTIINALDFQWQIKSWQQASENISDVIDDNKFLTFSYKSISVFIDSQESMIIPKDFFSITKQQYLLETYIGNSNFKAYSQKLKREDAYIIFGVFNNIHTTIKKQFPKAELFHNTAMSINNILINSKFNAAISVKIDSNSFEIVASKNSKLLAYNNFIYRTLDEFMFFILSFVKQNNIDINTVNLNISNPLLMSSPIALQLKQYFPNIIEYKNYSNKTIFDTLIKNTISANN